jgi:hypothetical protein
MSTKLTWNDRQIRGDVDVAVKIGIDQTLADSVAHAQLPKPTGAPRRTGAMANNISFMPAERKGNRVVGHFGNWTQDYTLIQELKNGFLRRAADRMFPTVNERISENMR